MLPAAWTEATLIAAVEDELESVTADLGLDTLDVIATAVTRDVPAVLGVASVEDVAYAGTADVVRVYEAARWKGWQKAYDVATTKYDLKSGSADLKRSQMLDGLRQKVTDARDAYYAAVAAAQAEAGTSSFFAFGTAPSCRGR